MQLDELERVEGILAESRSIHAASLVGLAINAPKELGQHEDRFWAVVGRPEVAPEAALEQGTQMLAELAYIARVNRRQRRQVH